MTPINANSTDNLDDFKYFIEFNYYSNEYGDGYEMVEMRINSYNDTNWDIMSGYGLQYLITDHSTAIFYGNIYEKDEHQFLFWGNNTYYYEYTFYNQNNKYKYYQTDHTTNNSILAYNSAKLQDNSQFLWKLGNNNYMLKFKNDFVYLGNNRLFFVDAHCYLKRNYMYFFTKVYSQLQSYDYGTTTNSIFNYGDLFQYYIEDVNILGSKQFIEVNQSSDLLQISKSDYLQMKVTKSRHGAKVASDSIFNTIDGNVSWKYNNGGNN